MPGNYTVLSDDRCLSEFITSINHRVSFIFTLLSASPVFPILFLLFHQNVHPYIHIYIIHIEPTCLYIHVKIVFNQLNQSCISPLTKLKTVNKFATYSYIQTNSWLLANTILIFFFDCFIHSIAIFSIPKLKTFLIKIWTKADIWIIVWLSFLNVSKKFLSIDYD